MQRKSKKGPPKFRRQFSIVNVRGSVVIVSAYRWWWWGRKISRKCDNIYTKTTPGQMQKWVTQSQADDIDFESNITMINDKQVFYFRVVSW